MKPMNTSSSHLPDIEENHCLALYVEGGYQEDFC